MNKSQFTFLIAALIVVIFVIKVLIEKNELEEFGLISNALVEEYSYVKYIDNEEAHKTIEFHRIVFSFEYEGQSFTSFSEIQPFQYKNLFERPLLEGDTIEIIFSTKNPEISEILLNKQ